MNISLIIFIFARTVYTFDVNFVSEETNGQLKIYGKIDIDCPKNDKFSIQLNLPIKNAYQETNDEGDWEYGFDFEDSPKNIIGTLNIITTVKEPYLEDFKIYMEIEKNENGKWQYYKIDGDLFTQNFLSFSSFVCDISQKFYLQVTKNTKENCIGEIDISFFKFIVDKGTLKTETRCKDDSITLDSTNVNTEDSSSKKIETTNTDSEIISIEEKTLQTITITKMASENTPLTTRIASENNELTTKIISETFQNTHNSIDSITDSSNDSKKTDSDASYNKKLSLSIGLILFGGVVLSITSYLILRFIKK